MYQIGLFSQMNHISTKALRHYDEIGLLKPDHVDYITGYRYYTNAQLPRLHRIIALKQLGLSLGDIGKVIENPLSIEMLLKVKEQELTKRVHEESLKLGQVKTWLGILKGGNPMNYNVVLKSLPAVTVASMRTIMPSYDSYFEVIPKMGEEMNEKGAVCLDPPYCFNLYHDGEYREKDIDVEVCEAVVKACEDSERVKYKNIPGIPSAACVMHKGPYSGLRDAYAFILKWIEDNGYMMSGKPRESYLDGIWNREDENDWLTEVQIPVELSEA